MSALTDVEDLDVLEDRVRESDSRPPLLPVQQLDLHRRPEAFHHRVVQPVTDRPERRQQPGGADLLPEESRGELGAMIRMNDPARRGATVPDGHVERVDDERGVLLGVRSTSR